MARTEGDTWDLASSVGATATGWPRRARWHPNSPNPLINDPFADALVKAVGLDYCNRMADGELEFGDDPLFNRQRICEQIAVRTRFFDDFFAVAASAGIRQAVILASGLDTRAYRLPWPPDAVVFEIDQPQVIEFKSSVLADLGAAAAADRRTGAIDLRDDWPTALRDSGFDPTPANGLDRRGTADLPAARRPGPLVRQHHRAQRARQPAGDRAHGHPGFTRRMDRKAQ